jgi:serine/threonine protein kinase
MKLGKYQLITRLGAGGMAELFLARSETIQGIEKIVALKRIADAHARDREFVRMFLEEARLATTLSHPNIAQVYEVGKEAGTYFFTMEYLQGLDLAKLIRRIMRQGEWPPVQQILTILIGTAAGLHYAHRKEGGDGRLLNIVHRDVSPSNLFITFDGGVKLLDFGIAKATTARSVTETGALKGKIPYMSPEQVRGEKIDQRSDIFSLGIVLWELLARRRMFPGKASDLQVMNMLAYEEIPAPSTVRRDVDPDLDRIVSRALQRDRNHRYPTAQALQVGLEEYARRRKISISSADLGRYMRDHFPQEQEESKASMIVRAVVDDAPARGRGRASGPGSVIVAGRSGMSDQTRLIVLAAAGGALGTVALGGLTYLLLM